VLNLRDVRDLADRLVDHDPTHVKDRDMVGDPHRLFRRLLDQQDTEAGRLQLIDDPQHLLDDNRGGPS
jgi:hypothetical protein